MVASSVLDYGWMAPIRRHTGPFLFMAERVFMYLDKEDVRSLVLEIKKTFPGPAPPGFRGSVGAAESKRVLQLPGST